MRLTLGGRGRLARDDGHLLPGVAARLVSLVVPLALAAPGLAAPAAAAQPPFPLGAYVGNPDGNNASNEASFEARFASFQATMGGAAPTFMNAFTDFTQAVADWPGNASWTAWSWTQSPVVRTAITPVIGIPMSDNAHWYPANDQFFRSIVAGTYDTAYSGVVDAWMNAGFRTLYLRLGYEMDGGFMPWYMGNDTTTQADWVAAFRHLSTLMRARAVSDGGHAYSVWNPADINWTALSVASAYPGDPYVDVISADVYSPLYTGTLYDWGDNNGTYDSDMQQWWAKAVNCDHWWNFPSSSQWSPYGNGSGWGMENTIKFAKTHKKAIAVSESGAGGNGWSTGPTDEPFFPAWLGRRMAHARALGITVAYVNIWDTWMGDGDWAFSEPGDGKPLEAAAWATAFGSPAN